MTRTPTLIAWYYVAVGVLLLAGQHFFLRTAHQESVTRLTAQHARQLQEAATPAAAAVNAPAAPANVVAAAPEATEAKVIKASAPKPRGRSPGPVSRRSVPR